MLQALIKKGRVFGEEVPAPIVSDGSVLIKVVYSCISAGTELSGVQGSGKSIIRRALEQPGHVKKVIDMAISDGIVQAYAKVRDKLESSTPTGYSISGIVIAVGSGVTAFQAGDHVAAAGAGLANHAEYVDVPVNLVMKMPTGMDFKSASTVTLGGIAMQGVRRADLRLGEMAVVVGAGILGLLTIQILKLSGARVAALDLDEKRLAVALEIGAELAVNPATDNAVNTVLNWSGGYGADVVIFSAATPSSEPLSESFRMCKRKGRVILVGVVGMEIKREDMYPKELDLLISTSYGPGRYDNAYEEKGLDYPYAYVRWTENRNMSEYLRLLAEGKLQIDKLINAVFPIEQVTDAFELLQTSPAKPLMVLLDYGMADHIKFDACVAQDRKVTISTQIVARDVINVALIGAGGFATGMHLPNIEKLPNKFRVHCVVSRTGYKAKEIAQRCGATYASTDIRDALKDKDVDLVLIATRHDNHAELAIQSLASGKHVFVEKPLATTRQDLERVRAFFDGSGDKPLLFTGFNRRFSVYAREIHKHVSNRINPMMIYYRMNAGYMPADHWVHEEGGRIIGEACHIIDLMSFLTGSRIRSVSVDRLVPTNENFGTSDNKAITISYSDGSLVTIHYFAIGSSKFPKEYMELHFDGKTIVLDDYRSLRGFGIAINQISTPNSQKGHLEELECLYNALKDNNLAWPIELWDMFQTTEATLQIAGAQYNQ